MLDVPQPLPWLLSSGGVNLETSLQSNAAAVTLVCAWYVLAS